MNIKNITFFTSLIFLSLPSHAVTPTHISEILGIHIGQEFPHNSPEYKSTIENVVVNGQKIEAPDKGGNTYIFIPKKNETGISFDEYNIVADKTGNNISGVLATKKYSSQELCDLNLKKMAIKLSTLWGKPALPFDKILYFSDFDNPLKTAKAICYSGQLDLSVIDAKLNL